MELNQMLADLLVQESRKVKTAYDPTCGFGGSLIAVYDALKRQGREQGVRFYAQDINPETISVAAWRFLLRGVTDFDFAVGDTLFEPQFHKGRTLQRFDLVVSVPYIYPTASRNMTSRDPYIRFTFGDVGRGRADYGFVQHVLASTAPKGCAVTTLALSSLGRSGYEQEIRGRIVRADLIDAVVSFPEFTSVSRKGMVGPTSALVFDLNKPGNAKDRVFFIHGQVTSSAPEAPPVSMLPVPEYVMEIYGEKSELPDTSAWAQIDAIEAHDYNLLPKLYIPQSPVKLDDVQTIEKRIRELSQESMDTQNEFESDIMYIYGAMNSEI